MRPKNQRKEVLINIMKKLLALLLCIMLLLPATSALAVNEELSGKVVIYTSMYQFVIDMMDEAMTKEFPNLDVEFFYGGTGSLQQKLAGEIETGKLGCDMMLVAEPAYSLELKEGGWLTTQAKVDDVFADPDAVWDEVTNRIALGVLLPGRYPKTTPGDPLLN